MIDKNKFADEMGQAVIAIRDNLLKPMHNSINAATEVSVQQGTAVVVGKIDQLEKDEEKRQALIDAKLAALESAEAKRQSDLERKLEALEGKLDQMDVQARNANQALIDAFSSLKWE